MSIQVKKPLCVIILAAGKGKRMNNPNLPKVMVELAKKPLIGHVLDQVHQLHPNDVILVVGHMKQKVKDYGDSLSWNNMNYVDQDEQLGTGHAVDQARENLKDFDGNTLILLGDVPLLRAKTLERFLNEHNTNEASVSVLSAMTQDPTGYGRIVRNDDNSFVRITEHKDASREELMIEEINSGIFCVDNQKLFEALAKVENSNAQGEYYLTDIVELIRKEGDFVQALPLAGIDELQGVNNTDDLERAEKYYNSMIKVTK